VHCRQLSHQLIQLRHQALLLHLLTARAHNASVEQCWQQNVMNMGQLL
jgi:hypothetical protein